MSVDNITPLPDHIELEAQSLAEYLLTRDSRILGRAKEIIQEITELKKQEKVRQSVASLGKS